MRHRNLILGILGVVWGAGLFISFFLKGGQVSGSGAYAAGQLTGVIFGVLLLSAGLYAIFASRKNRTRCLTL